MERDKDALLEHYASMAPGTLASLTPEERHRVYKMLRLKVIARPEGDGEIAGELLCIPDLDKMEEGDEIEERSKLETAWFRSIRIP